MKIAMVDIVQVKPITKAPKHKIVWLTESKKDNWKLGSKLLFSDLEGTWKVDAILTSTFTTIDIKKVLKDK